MRLVSKYISFGLMIYFCPKYSNYFVRGRVLQMMTCLPNTGVIVWCIFFCCETISTEIMFRVADNFNLR